MQLEEAHEVKFVLDFLPHELIDIVAKGGAALSPLLLFLWWRADTERRDTQRKFDTMVDKTLLAMTELNAVVRGIDRMLSDRHK